MFQSEEVSIVSFKDSKGNVCVVDLHCYEDVYDNINFLTQDGLVKDEEYIKRFESGELASVCIKVRKYDQEGRFIGDDTLCDCHVKTDSIDDDILAIAKDSWF